jgi:hypothetical protein
MTTTAPGATTHEVITMRITPMLAAAPVQQLAWQAADEALGDSESEQLFRDVLIAGHLKPLRSHEAAASKVLSRAAHLRRLRTAAERLAEHMPYVVPYVCEGDQRLPRRL